MEYERRLPIYLLVDCSSSMAGDSIEAVKQGIKALLSELLDDPQALETAFLSVITFSSCARQIVPLTPLLEFREPSLSAGGVSALGAALHLLEECVDREVRTTTAKCKGDWKPVAFILTDGAPTDAWRETASRLKASNKIKLIGCAAGAQIEKKILEEITDTVLIMNTLTAGDLSQFFSWASASAGTVLPQRGTEKEDASAEGFLIL